MACAVMGRPREWRRAGASSPCGGAAVPPLLLETLRLLVQQIERLAIAIAVLDQRIVTDRPNRSRFILAISSLRWATIPPRRKREPPPGAVPRGRQSMPSG